MAEITLRFYGRYVLANEFSQGKLTGKLTMLAPFLRSKPNEPHHVPYMGIPRHALSGDEKDTTLPPSLRTMTDGVATDAEYCLWDLSGASLKVGKSGLGKIIFADPIVELEDLEKQQGRKAVFDQANLKAGVLVGSAIEVNGGTRVAQALFPNQCEYLALTDAMDGNQGNDNIIRPAQQEADLFEVVYAVSDSDPRFVIAIEKGGTSYQVTVKVKSGGQAVVSFTNLCPRLPPAERYDLEFAGYYDVLQSSGANRLIPKVSHLGPVADCDIPCSVTYEP